MIPAFLLLPWVGLGLNRLCKKIITSGYKKMIMILIIVTVLAPAIKTLNLTLHNDNSIPRAVQWLSENIQNTKMKIVTNNKRVSFYIKLEQREDINQKILFYN